LWQHPGNYGKIFCFGWWKIVQIDVIAVRFPLSNHYLCKKNYQECVKFTTYILSLFCCKQIYAVESSLPDQSRSGRISNLAFYRRIERCSYMVLADLTTRKFLEIVRSFLRTSSCSEQLYRWDKS
jgi:hypothetical protein